MGALCLSVTKKGPEEVGFNGDLALGYLGEDSLRERLQFLRHQWSRREFGVTKTVNHFYIPNWLQRTKQCFPLDSRLGTSIA